MSRRDPHHDRKVYHMADKTDGRGAVSALCYKRPRPINLKIALWTLRADAVTCRACLARIRERSAVAMLGYVMALR